MWTWLFGKPAKTRKPARKPVARRSSVAGRTPVAGRTSVAGATPYNWLFDWHPYRALGNKYPAKRPGRLQARRLLQKYPFTARTSDDVSAEFRRNVMQAYRNYRPEALQFLARVQARDPVALRAAAKHSKTRSVAELRNTLLAPNRNIELLFDGGNWDGEMMQRRLAYVPKKLKPAYFRR